MIRKLDVELVGKQLAEPVVDDRGMMLLPKDTVLTSEQVQYLIKRGFEDVLVRATQNQAAVTPAETLVRSIRLIFNEIRLGNSSVAQELGEEIVDSLFVQLQSEEEVVKLLLSVQAYDSLSYQHSAKSAAYSGLLAKWLGYPPHRIKNALISGLLHDVGKVNVPDYILNKTEPLTAQETEIARNHAFFGYAMIKSFDLDQEVLDGIRYHHERIDGSGYPDRLVGNQVSEFVQVIAIGDIFAALTSNISYRTAFNVFRSLEILLLEKLDPTLLRTFVDRFSRCFIGVMVLLNDNSVAEVLKISPSHPSRPIVLRNAEYVDLSQLAHQDKYISELVI